MALDIKLWVRRVNGRMFYFLLVWSNDLELLILRELPWANFKVWLFELSFLRCQRNFRNQLLEVWCDWSHLFLYQLRFWTLIRIQFHSDRGIVLLNLILMRKLSRGFASDLSFSKVGGRWVWSLWVLEFWSRLHASKLRR